MSKLNIDPAPAAAGRLREAAQQALEALTPFVRGNWTPGLAVQAAAAMACLESALAEPVQEPCNPSTK